MPAGVHGTHMRGMRAVSRSEIRLLWHNYGEPCYVDVSHFPSVSCTRHVRSRMNAMELLYFGLTDGKKWAGWMGDIADPVN